MLNEHTVCGWMQTVLQVGEQEARVGSQQTPLFRQDTLRAFCWPRVGRKFKDERDRILDLPKM